MHSRVLLADDHTILRQGLRGLLERAGHEVVGEASNGREALTLARTLGPDVAVLDVSMPSLNGLDAADQMRRLAPKIKIILLTMYTERTYVLRALRVGVSGYLLKSQAAEDLIRAIREVRAGEIYLSPGVSASVVDAYLAMTRDREADRDPLTPRERQIVQLVAEGHTTKEIGRLLGVSFKTAESHRNRVMRKLDIHDVAGLVRYAIHHGLVQVAPRLLAEHPS